MDTKIMELAVELVRAQVSLNKMTAEEMESALLRVYNALYRMRQAEREEKPIALDERAGEQVPASGESAARMDPRASIQEDKVICLECGAEFKQLTANHLQTHGLNPREYKRKWGFPLKQPLAARVLTRSRSQSAKKRGLPAKLQQYLDSQREKKLSTSDDTPAARPPARRTIRRHAAR